MRRLIFITTFFVLIPPIGVHAEWKQGSAERLFGPEMSEEQACGIAERKARENALKKVTGEKLTSEDLLVCSEKSEEASCNLNRVTWSTIDGEIKGIRNRRVKTETAHTNYRKCTVVLEADIGTAEGQPDPGFDMTVRLNEKAFKDGDNLTISIAPSQPMYVTVFQWLPYEKGNNQVFRIFPNPYDKVNYFTKINTVPTSQGRQDYDMAIAFPPGMAATQRLVDEYVMIVGTKENITFRQSYRLDEFKGRLLEIPRQYIRLVRRGYAIVKNQ